VRKIIVYIATSADGFIARPNGDVEWLNRPRTAGDYGMGDFYRSVDTVVMGRKTYDVGRKLGQSHYRGKKNYVLSRKRAPHRPQDVEFVSCAIPKFATQLRRTDGRDIWLVGGAKTIAGFLDAGHIDEFVIHVIPAFIGKGIPLIAARHRLTQLKLLGTKTFKDGVVRLHYSVAQRAASA